MIGPQLFHFSLRRRSPTFGGRGETKTQTIAMKFGMLVIGVGENAMSIDELAKKKSFWGIP